MDIDSLEHRVPKKLWPEFRTFLKTGEASSTFLEQLDGDPALQAVAEEVFEAEAARFEHFAAGIRELGEASVGGERMPDILSSELARTMRRATTLPPDAQHRLAEQTASALRRSASPQERQRVSSMVSQLSQALKA